MAALELKAESQSAHNDFDVASLELKAEKQSAHTGTVCSVAFSPDGATIVSGSSDSTIKVWDAGARRH